MEAKEARGLLMEEYKSAERIGKEEGPQGTDGRTDGTDNSPCPPVCLSVDTARISFSILHLPFDEDDVLSREYI